jgi:hypothetical protein
VQIALPQLLNKHTSFLFHSLSHHQQDHRVAPATQTVALEQKLRLLSLHHSSAHVLGPRLRCMATTFSVVNLPLATKQLHTTKCGTRSCAFSEL